MNRDLPVTRKVTCAGANTLRNGPRARASGGRTYRPLRGGHLLLDFINTASDHTAQPREDDLAPGYVNLVDWCTFAGVVDEATATRLLRLAHKEPREAAAVRRRAIALRGALHGIVGALLAGDAPAQPDMDLFNEELQAALRNGALVAGAGVLRWQWQERAGLDRPLWIICRAATELLVSDRIARIRECASPQCHVLFLDVSKNNSRQYCSSAGCGSAARVRRFRERQREVS